MERLRTEQLFVLFVEGHGELRTEQDRLKREMNMKNGDLQQKPRVENADSLRELLKSSSSVELELQRRKELKQQQASNKTGFRHQPQHRPNNRSIKQQQLKQQVRHYNTKQQELQTTGSTPPHKQQQLKQQMSDLQQKIWDLRTEGTDPTERQSLRRKNLRAQRLLEDKLQKAMTQLNQQMIRNRALREELQTVFGERALCLRIVRTHRKELHELKQQIKEASEECLALSEHSIEYHQRRAALRDKLVKERAEYNAEIQNLQLMSSYKTDLNNFLWSKQDEREDGHEAESRSNKTKDVFDRISSETGDEGLDKLAEDQNFALCKFVNEQNKEIVALKDEIVQVKEEMGKSEERHKERKGIHRAKMEELRKQLQEVEARTQLYENQSRQKNSAVEQLQKGLKSICHVISCDCDHGITSCLRALEQWTNQMLSIKAWVDEEQKHKEAQ
ncbi:hypothetical protein WMY93_011303 [Mugilogobius chulae]|uniref:ODAD1 central coiled coil region domain-containing protein n=1 Tax=Mugilogobius chulae TaxID=88201 RepID=A0AAW0P5M2_9GOBI